jgi:hypothetical protein
VRRGGGGGERAPCAADACVRCPPPTRPPLGRLLPALPPLLSHAAAACRCRAAAFTSLIQMVRRAVECSACRSAPTSRRRRRSGVHGDVLQQCSASSAWRQHPSTPATAAAVDARAMRHATTRLPCCPCAAPAAGCQGQAASEGD